MKSLPDLRAQHGWFTFPEPEELYVAVTRINRLLAAALDDLPLAGCKAWLVRAARLDLAGRALSAGEGYARQVESFKDLTRAELDFVAAWIEGCDLRAELALLGWLPAPTARRIARLLAEEEAIPERTRARLVEWFCGGG